MEQADQQLLLHDIEEAAKDEMPPFPTKKRGSKWWLLVSLYIFFVLFGQTAGVLLGRLYYDNGGNSKWMQSIVVSAGFPFLLPALFYFCSPSIPNHDKVNILTDTSPSTITLILLYTFFGVSLTANNLMYAYGMLYLPVSTFSLVCASQLAFNVLFSYFLNSLKVTPFVINSVVQLTMSASLIALNSESTVVYGITNTEFIVGLLCTIGASALFSLLISLTQLAFDKVLNDETFLVKLEMQIYPAMVSTCICLVGFSISGEWRSLKGEMKQFGEVSYVMILVSTSMAWTVFYVGTMGLIYEVSSLFMNVINTVSLPIIPVFGVIFFHDKMDGVTVVALLLAFWGFISYMYQNYLDDLKSKPDKVAE